MRTSRQVSSQWSVVSSKRLRTTDHGLLTPDSSAFTLIEILVVVAIIAIVMTMGVPFMRTAIDGGKGMTRAVKDVQEVCSHARAMAILQQTTTELVIHPREGSFDIGVSSGGKSGHEPPQDEGNPRQARRLATSIESGSRFAVKDRKSVV